VTPRLAPGVRVRFDKRDGTPVLLSPERGLRLSETAAGVVALCDGTRTLEGIVQSLAARYTGAGLERIDADVRGLMSELGGRGLIMGLEPRGSAPGPGARAVSLRDGRDSGELLYTLVAELTHRCPLACPYCSNPLALVRGPDELTTADWLRVIDEAAAIGVMQVHLSGGEPLARADLEAIAARAREADLYVNLVTSGVPLERARLERLARWLDHVQLSVQDTEAETSDRMSGATAFEQKMRVAAWVKEMRLPLTLNVVLHRANIDRLEAVVEMAERLGADRLELANVQLVSWALENREALLPSSSQIERARAAAREQNRRLGGTMQVVFVLPDWYADRPRACMDGWARRFVVVAPDGVVLPCHAARTLPLAFESVRARSLGDIWRESSALRAFRGEAWMPEPCKSCDRRGVDFGGCRCQAFALTGDARATDPACSLAPGHRLVEVERARADRVAETPRIVFRGRSTPGQGRP
jgi:pyrroloquinoline quinone biosynthesis protein E